MSTGNHLDVVSAYKNLKEHINKSTLHGQAVTSGSSSGLLFVLFVFVFLIFLIFLGFYAAFHCASISKWPTWLLVLIIVLYFSPIGGLVALGVIIYWLSGGCKPSIGHSLYF